MRPKYLNIKNNIAYLRDHSLIDIANTYQTPLFVIDEYEIKENMDTFLEGFSSNNIVCHTVYASKALLIPALIDLAKEKGLFIDAVSYGDLYVLKNSHFKMNHVIFHGNNKSLEEIEFAVKNKVIIVVDHLEELELIINVSNKLNIKVQTMFRINPGIEAHTHKYIQTSLNTSKFGESILDKERLAKIMNLYKNNPSVKLLGFHSHIGSQILEEEPFLLNIRKMMEFSKKIEEEYHYHLSSINLGGGFGIKYLESDTLLDLNSLLKKMVKEIELLNNEYHLHIKNAYIEPGRSILGNACVTLYKCSDTKVNINNHKYLFIDGGMADNIRPALYQAEYSADLIDKMNDKKTEMYDIAGKCCESGDVIIKDLDLPKADNGDILMVYSTGAYTYSMASNYNNMLKPAIVFVGDDVKLVAKRQELKDLMKFFK